MTGIESSSPACEQSPAAASRLPAVAESAALCYISPAEAYVDISCLDLEGVLVPEIWIRFAEVTGVSELALTTRDIPDYDQLMRHRIDVLARHKYKLQDIQRVIEHIEPLNGAAEFLTALRKRTQVAILSDTFVPFAEPLMAKLGRPLILCNELEIDSSGAITGYRLRQQAGKKRAVEGFQYMGLAVTAVGDSYNDLHMLRAADRAALFRPPERIAAEVTDLVSISEFDALLHFLLQPAESAVAGRSRKAI